ncbi:RNA polymerase sigma-70 factor, ECF subfamily [Tenacibaculum sp. MAR_2009_124]|uniref:RNA polymerase sigma factor n=1 Tax=Tenacibaculum sp. MAR_2009_124 TaxID=1250059 RepID=UPI000895CFF5|nr:sigma-70 family RNA polymerase sigma factor [Tenacibaculum sp. MAR_2009_124]SEB51918.1 RNA polymerase sigma-70 factor, ECF subfamily [Tenacibaculum sp. MAR_2009_124]
MVFEDIYNSYWQKIFRVCMGYVNDHAKAQDLTQDIFVIVWKNLPTFRKESNIGTWIFRIATNYCLRQIEKDKRIKKSELPLNIKEDNEISIEGQIKQLYQYISSLSEIERIIISLELEDINQAQIAEIVGITPQNVRVKIHRIKQKLTQKFKENAD